MMSIKPSAICEIHSPWVRGSGSKGWPIWPHSENAFSFIILYSVLSISWEISKCNIMYIMICVHNSEIPC